MDFKIAATPQEKEYDGAEYRQFLKEKNEYMDFDEFCRQEGI
ncbi:MAG TPA: hypothetical protein VMY43_07720 [Methanothrix sp.]|nr:hypothetical protein [Methanothrix sp.]